MEDAVGMCMSEAKAVAETHATVKSHLARIKSILASWMAKLIVERKSGQVPVALRWLQWHCNPLIFIAAQFAVIQSESVEGLSADKYHEKLEVTAERRTLMCH